MWQKMTKAFAGYGSSSPTKDEIELLERSRVLETYLTNEVNSKMFGGYGTNSTLIYLTEGEKCALASFEINDSSAINNKEQFENSQKLRQIMEKSGMRKLSPGEIEPEVIEKLQSKNVGLKYDEKTGNFIHKKSDLRVGVYKDSNGKIYVAFIGYGDNDLKGRWNGFVNTDIKQAFGEDGVGQYKLAMKVGDVFYEKYKDNVIFTGQSLGGGLASAVGFKTGAKTITFNSPGLHYKTVGYKDEADLIIRNMKIQNIKSYDVKGEFVWEWQENTFKSIIPDVVGQKIYLEPVNPKLNMFNQHYPENILPALNKYYYDSFYNKRR